MLSRRETNQSEIGRILQVDKSVICKDVAVIREQALDNLQHYILFTFSSLLVFSSFNILDTTFFAICDIPRAIGKTITSATENKFSHRT
jgi:hypothetical protein